MNQKEFEERIKSPAIQDMILSHQIGGVAYELSKRLNISPARALDLFYRARHASTYIIVKQDFISTAISILLTSLCLSVKQGNREG